MAEQADVSNNLQMTGKPVLVESPLGIFYGVLEKSDTRNGTALLSNGFMLSQDRHITFTQYMDFLLGELEGAYLDWVETDQDDESWREEPTYPNQLSIAWDTYQEHMRKNTITDYATGGVYLTQFRTATHWNSSKRQELSSLISLSDVLGIVVVQDQKKVRDHELLSSRLINKGDIFGGREESVARLALDDLQGAGVDEPDMFDASNYSSLQTFERLTDHSKDDLPSLVVNTRRRKHILEGKYAGVQLNSLKMSSISKRDYEQRRVRKEKAYISFKSDNFVYCRRIGRNKYLYESEAKVRVAIKFQSEVGIKRGYYCHSCIGFHATSKTLEEYRETRQNYEQFIA